MIRISIVVVVYNVEEYLRACLESLVNQTLEEIEIIVVNDASPDKSDMIMKEYESRYPNKVKCLYLDENLCLGGARNKGIEIAAGQYIMFVDSDDYIDINMCEKLYCLAAEKNADVVCSDYMNKWEQKSYWMDMYPNQFMGTLDAYKKQLFISVASASSVAKIIKRNMILEHHIFFPEHMKYEDIATMPLLWVYADNIYKIKEPLYIYRRRENSITLSENNIGHYDRYYAMKYICRELIDRKIFDENSEEIRSLYVAGVLNTLNILIERNSMLDREKIHEIREEVITKEVDYRNDPFMYFRCYPRAICMLSDLIHSEEACIRKFENGEYKKLTNEFIDYYRRYKQKTESIFQYCAQRNYKIGIWGAGGKGSDFLKICDSQNEKVQYVFDKNKDKWGTKTETGHEISGFMEHCKEVDLILVMNKVYFNGINAEIKAVNPEIKTINMDVYYLMENCQGIEYLME